MTNEEMAQVLIKSAQEHRKCAHQEWHKDEFAVKRRLCMLAVAEASEAGAAALRREEWRDIKDAPKDRSIEAIDKRTGFVRTVTYHHCSTAWELAGTSDTYYAPDYFTHYRELPAPPEAK